MGWRGNWGSGALLLHSSGGAGSEADLINVKGDDNDPRIVGATFDGPLCEVRSAPGGIRRPVAVARWSGGGAALSYAEIDIVAGTNISVPCSFLRISAFLDEGSETDGNYHASCAFGGSRTDRNTRTLYPTIGPTSTVTIPVKPFAWNFMLVRPDIGAVYTVTIQDRNGNTITIYTLLAGSIQLVPFQLTGDSCQVLITGTSGMTVRGVYGLNL